MKISYDSKYDVVYIKLIDGVKEVSSKHLNEDITIDFDEKRRMVGIEILSASRYLELGSLLPITIEKAKTAG